MRVVILILLSLALVLDARALSVASDYLEGDRLILADGTSKIYSIRLQNPDSGELAVRIDYDKDHMKIIGSKEEFTLPPSSSTRVEFNVTAPKYVKNNNLFPISYTVHQVSGAGGQGTSFLGRISKNFNLEVIRDPNRFYFDIEYAVIGAAALAFLLYILRKNINGIKGYWKRRGKGSSKAFRKGKINKW
ncbi:hypothetical protein HYU09_02465 [Candidatus Woesearchaeota archaeon]|nr:hypothetical protein [Candidatus Woesearchaeota archaeon]